MEKIRIIGKLGKIHVLLYLYVISQCWNYSQQKKHLLIANKTPIQFLWFGNVDEYIQSLVFRF